MVEAGLADGGNMTLGDHQSGNRADECNERQIRADRQQQNRQHEAHHRGDGADDDRPAGSDTTRFDVAPEARVALELFFDLSQDPLFVL